MQEISDQMVALVSELRSGTTYFKNTLGLLNQELAHNEEKFNQFTRYWEEQREVVAVQNTTFEQRWEKRHEKLDSQAKEHLTKADSLLDKMARSELKFHLENSQSSYAP